MAYVGDALETNDKRFRDNLDTISVTLSAILVTKILKLLKLASGTNTENISPRS